MIRTAYAYIDRFRLLAALTVIAIHTAPFSAFSPALDKILVCGAGRIAVPFFLMTTGYFVLAPYVNGGFTDNRRYRRHLRKILLAYGASALLYMPVIWYAGKLPRSPGELIKMLIFDGPFYHLWYFPAVLLGCVLLIWLLKRYSARSVLTVTALLYLFGLFGDSYYGIIADIPMLRRLYGGIFSVSSYTRNGIFYAPLFLLLGVLLTKKECRCGENTCRYGTAAGLLAIMTECFLTDRGNLQRHSSMYLMLPITMYFLYQLLLKPGGKAPKFLRTGTAFLYVIHPLCIVLVRGTMGLSGLEKWLAERSFLYYIMVCLVSLCMTAGYLYLDGRRKAYGRKKQGVDRA